MSKTKDKRCATMQKLSKCRFKYNIVLKTMMMSGALLLLLLEIAHQVKSGHYENYNAKYR